MGLAPKATKDGGGSLWALFDWWKETYSNGKASHSRNESVIRAHFEGTELARLPLIAVTPERIETFLQAKARKNSEDEDGLAPATINQLRALISRAFNAARRAGRYAGPNPAEAVMKRRVPRRAPDYLRFDEVPRVLRALAPRWQPLFATAVYTGLRKGELLGLRKRDIDLQARLLTVERSYARETT